MFLFENNIKSLENASTCYRILKVSALEMLLLRKSPEKNVKTMKLEIPLGFNYIKFLKKTFLCGEYHF